MKRRILSCLLALVMILSLLPVLALAAEPTASYSVGTVQEFIDAVDEINNASSGSYVISLQDSIDLSSQVVEFTSQTTTTILGNSHTLTTSHFGSIGLATLNLGQADGSDALDITGNSPDTPIVYADGFGKLNIYDGVTLRDNATFGSAGAVQLNNGALCHMYGGTITNCMDQTGTVGGGVLVADRAKFYMHGGTISNCQVGVHVQDSAAFYLMGGEITGCTAAGYSGGVLIFSNASFEMTGGKITGCTGNYGGGILTLSPKSTITGGEISGNSATLGGGIFIWEGKAEISDAVKLYANSASGGSDIFLYKQDGTVELTLGNVPGGLYLPDDPQEIDGWYLDYPDPWELGDEKVDISTPFTDTIGLKAAHGRHMYVVSYDLNGGTPADNETYDDQTVAEGTTVTIAAAPTKSGYIFNGWSDGENTYLPGDPLTVTGNITLTAVWQIDTSKEYTVTYYVDGEIIRQEKVKGGETAPDFTPSKTDCVFTGWYTDPEGTQAYDMSTPVISDLALYAGWKQLTYTLHYGDGREDYTDYYVPDNRKTLPTETRKFDQNEIDDTAYPGVDQAGYYFLCWMREVDGEFITEWQTPGTDCGNIDYYAQWMLIEINVKVDVKIKSDISITGIGENGEPVAIDESQKAALAQNINPATDIHGNSIKIDLTAYLTNAKNQAEQDKITEYLSGRYHYGNNRLDYDGTVIKTITTDGVVESPVTLHELKAPIKITFAIPNEWQRRGTVSMFRAHTVDNEPIVTALPDLDSNAATYTIESDKFSTYTMIYVPTPAGGGTTPGNTRPPVPEMLNGGDHFAYIVGYADGTVRPEENISRAETAMIFFRLLTPEVRDRNLTSYNPFTDVQDDMWYTKAISTMAKLGILKGRTSETFDPDAPITRAEFATICARFDDSKTTGSSKLTDLSGHWAKADIERAVSLGWIMGYTDGTFRPDNYITRAEAMTMINRILQRIPEDKDDLLPGMRRWTDNLPGTWYYLAVQEATNSHEFRNKRGGYEYWTRLTDDPDWTKYQD